MIDTSAIRDRFGALAPHLDERGRRSFAAAEARSAGYGGIAAVARATGIAPSTIGRGLEELADASPVASDRNCRTGGGRKSLTIADPTLLGDLLALVSPSERGDPMSPLRWTCKSLRRLVSELCTLGHHISHTVVGELLKGENFSLQANSKTRESASHPDRDAQFAHINASVADALAQRQPAISVDTKTKELVGHFKNAGRAVPYGVYDLAANTGWVSVGIDHDTAEFAVRTIRTWWHNVGSKRYLGARHLTITVDGGGSNGSRVRLWKRELQKLATELGIDITVHHLPPGTSKWNKVEHRLFSFITMNWRAKPLVSYRVIVDLISATTTDTGLTVACELDTTTYPKGIAVAERRLGGVTRV
jgi:hypothetical protein